MSDTLDKTLPDYIVKVVVPGRSIGTGFFVAPSYLLTCAHVVRSASQSTVEIFWAKTAITYTARVVAIADDRKTLDVALLRLEGDIPKHPCVYLDDALEPRDEDIRLKDDLFRYGYLKSYPNGAGVSVEHESFTGDDPPLIKFKDGQIESGLSGSALLNVRTGKVCGIVKETRGALFPNGGGAVPISVAYQKFLPWIDLRHEQRVFHQRNLEWTRLLPSSQPALQLVTAPASKSRNRQIEEVLGMLNAISQKNEFAASFARLDAIGAFLIRADEEHIQEWLVKRLFLKIPGNQKANTLSLKVTSRLKRDFSLFWEALSELMKLPGQPSPPEILRFLCDRAQTEPFVIALYGVHSLGPNLQKFISDFWCPLVEQITASDRELNGYCVVFLTEEGSSAGSWECVQRFNPAAPHQVVALNPLERIEFDEIRTWLRQTEVSELLKQCNPDKFEQCRRELLQADRQWESPQETLDDICAGFGLNTGIEALTPYWKLAG